MTATAVSLAVAFLTTPLLVRWLGAERFGAARTLADWFAHLSLLELGLGGALPPLLALAWGRGDAPSVRRTLAAGVRAFGLVAVAALAGGLLIMLFAGHLVSASPTLLSDLRTAAAVGLATALLYPLLPFQSLLDASQRGYVIQWFSLSQSLVTTAIALILARAGWGVTGQFIALMAGLALFRVGVAVAGARQAPGAFAAVRKASESATLAEIRRLNLPTFLVTLAGRVGLFTDNIIVGWMLGASSVTPLFLTQRLASMAGLQLLGVGNASWAALAELHALGRREVFAQRLVELTRLLAGLAVALLVPIAAFNRAFVTRWVGADAFGGDALTVLACINAFLVSLMALWGWCFGGTGQMRLLAPAALASAAVNIVVSIAATRLYGLPGPLIGTAAGAVGVYAWYLPLLLAKHFAVAPLALLRAALQPIVWGVPAGFGLWVFAERNPPASWLVLLAEMAASALLLLVVWWLAALTHAERESFRARIAAVFSRAP